MMEEEVFNKDTIYDLKREHRGDFSGKTFHFNYLSDLKRCYFESKPLTEDLINSLLGLDIDDSEKFIIFDELMALLLVCHPAKVDLIKCCYYNMCAIAGETNNPRQLFRILYVSQNNLVEHLGLNILALDLQKHILDDLKALLPSEGEYASCLDVYSIADIFKIAVYCQYYAGSKILDNAFLGLLKDYVDQVQGIFRDDEGLQKHLIGHVCNEWLVSDIDLKTSKLGALTLGKRYPAYKAKLIDMCLQIKDKEGFYYKEENKEDNVTTHVSHSDIDSVPKEEQLSVGSV